MKSKKSSARFSLEQLENRLLYAVTPVISGFDGNIANGSNLYWPAGKLLNVTAVDTTKDSDGSTVTGTTYSTGSGSNALNTRFDWTFGETSDSIAGFTTHNKMTGFNAAHIYDVPDPTGASVHDLTLKTTDQTGAISTSIVHVHVTSSTFGGTTSASNITGSPTNVIYVDSVSGSDNNNGNSAPVQTFAKALTLLNDNMQIRLKRGQVFTVSSTGSVSKNNVLIGAYGNSADQLPILSIATTSDINVINLNSGTNSIVVQDVTINTQSGSAVTSGIGIKLGGKYEAVRNVQFQNNHDAAVNDGGRGTMVADSSGLNEMNGYGIYNGNSDFVAIGNDFSYGSATQPTIRTTGGTTATKRVLLQDNLSEQGNQTGMVIRGGTQYAYAYHNTVTGNLGIGPGTGTGTYDLRQSYIVLDSNHLIGGSINNGATFTGVDHVVIRNNIVELPSTGGWGIFVGQSTSPLTNAYVYIVNNTFTGPTHSGHNFRLMEVVGNIGDGTSQSGIVLENNLMATSPESSDRSVIVDNSTLLYSVKTNIYTDPPTTSDVNTVLGDGKTITEWNALTLGNGSTPSDVSKNLSLGSNFLPTSLPDANIATANGYALFDYNGVKRPTSAVTVGAVQSTTDTTVILSTEADAFVKSGSNANTNYGQNTALEVKNDGGDLYRQSYLRFDFSSASTITTATLRLYGLLSGAFSGGVNISVYDVTDTNWGENSITYNSPPTGTPTAISGATFNVPSTTAQWIECDLTTYLQGKKTAGASKITLLLKTTATSAPLITFNSGEAFSNQPQLVVVGQAQPPTVTASAEADSFVKSGSNGNTNYGQNTALEVKNDGGDLYRQSYLRFDFSGVSTINSAKLRLYGQLSGAFTGGVNISVYDVTDTAWGENTVTYNNEPTGTGTSAVATFNVPSTTAQWIECDLTTYLQSKLGSVTKVTLMLKTTAVSAPLISFNSGEASTNQPQLVFNG